MTSETQVLRKDLRLSSSCCALAAAIYLSSCLGCSRKSVGDYKATIKSGRTAIPVAVQMEKMFGDADHFITHYGMGSRSETRHWQTEVFFGGRYCLTMQVDVLIDYETNTVKMAGEPIFCIVELAKIDVLANGNTHSKSRDGKFFSLAEWDKFFDSDGDFSVIGMKKNPNSVQNFDRLVAGVRKDRIPVSLLPPKSPAMKNPNRDNSDSQEE